MVAPLPHERLCVMVRKSDVIIVKKKKKKDQVPLSPRHD